MEIVKNEVTQSSNSNQKIEIKGNISWNYDKDTKKGRLILKKDNGEAVEVNNLIIRIKSIYFFIKEQGKKQSMSLLVMENNEYYFLSLPLFYFIDIYNNNPIKMKLVNENGKLQINYLEIVDKRDKIADDKKYFNLLNFLANADNSDLVFTIKIFIK